MPVSPTYPGVYIQEIPSGVRTITGVATSITAFVGRALKGETDEPVRVQSFSEFARLFGGLWIESTMSYAVQQYFQHGGTDSLIVRVFNGDQDANTSTISLLAGGGTFTLRASSAGLWGNNLRAIVNYDTKDEDDDNLFNLFISEIDPDSGGTVTSESFLNLSIDEVSPRFVRAILEQQSALVRVDADQAFPSDRPDPSPPDAEGNPVATEASGGDDGGDITDDDIGGPNAQSDDLGLYALRRADLFNLLCIPPLTRAEDVDLDTTIADAASFCKTERAMLIVDPRADWNTVTNAEQGINAIRAAVGTDASTNVLIYFPRLNLADPLKENRTEEFVPCGAIAGIIARTDAQRGVWKAAAGLEASLSGVRKLSYKLTDLENGRLNPRGMNCIRSFPVFGNVVWGARTLAGADILASEWKYAPVRRVALFIEESLYRGTQWVVFEPNDEPLWAQIRLNIGAFMQNLFLQGAFQGKTPREAYLVKCDSETTTQNDINQGIVNILVGFAPLKPAEFVIIRIQQLAGQIQA